MRPFCFFVIYLISIQNGTCFNALLHNKYYCYVKFSRSNVQTLSASSNSINNVNKSEFSVQFAYIQRYFHKIAAMAMLIPILFFGSSIVKADDELARYASEGNKVGVDGQCFLRKCAIETSRCANDRNCFKGLSCLARCKGGSLCSTGCFAKYGSENLDNLISCSIEKNDCVHVPRQGSYGWTDDKIEDLPILPVKPFHLASLRGTWYKVMGLDSRYDCFDCQKNSFIINNKHTVDMKASFRIPRPPDPRNTLQYLESDISEQLTFDPTSTMVSRLQSKGEMFGLTFWENWYIIGERNIVGRNSNSDQEDEQKNNNNINIFNKKLLPPSQPSISPPLPPSYQYNPQNINNVMVEGVRAADNTDTTKNVIDTTGTVSSFDDSSTSSYMKETQRQPLPTIELKLVYYTGHTLQGNYKGAFLYSRSPDLSPRIMREATKLIKDAGLEPNDFCIIRNQCFKIPESTTGSLMTSSEDSDDVAAVEAPFWYLGQRFFQDTSRVADELKDWFQDPKSLSDWLIDQQQRMIVQQPFAVSPFASLPEDYTNNLR